MKLWEPTFLAHFLQGSTRLQTVWRVRRLDNQTFGFTDGSKQLTIDGVDYLPRRGLQTSSVQNSEGLSVQSIDVTAFLDHTTEQQMLAGIWHESRVDIAEVNWSAPPPTWDVTRMNVLRSGILGRIEQRNLRFTAEVRPLASRLEKKIGRIYSPVCIWRYAIWQGGTFISPPPCSADLSGRIHTGTVTALGDDPRYTFHASALALPSGYFAAGLVAITSGANANLGQLSLMDVRRWEPPLMTLHRPLPYAVAIGDTFTAVQGDDRTWQTCRGTFNNGRHFGGQPYIPGIDAVLQNPLIEQPLLERPAPPDGNPDYAPGGGSPEDGYGGPDATN